jgi:hypothetical protein
MVNASEGVMRRRQADPAYAGYLSTRQEAGPKREWFLAWFATRKPGGTQYRTRRKAPT